MVLFLTWKSFGTLCAVDMVLVAELQAMAILAGGGGYVAPTPAAPAAAKAAAKAAPLAT